MSLNVRFIPNTVSFPVWQEPRVGVGFHEVNARQSDFAFVSAAADAAKFAKFAEYLRTHGLLRVDRIQTKSDKVH